MYTTWSVLLDDQLCGYVTVLKDFFLLFNRFSKLRRSVWSRFEDTHDFHSLEHWCSFFDSRTGHGYVRPMLFSVTLEQVMCFCELGNEHSVSIHCDKLVGPMRVYYFIKNDCFNQVGLQTFSMGRSPIHLVLQNATVKSLCFGVLSEFEEGFVHESLGRKLCRSNTI